MLFSPCGGSSSEATSSAAWVAGLVAAVCESNGSALFLSVGAVSGGCSAVSDTQGIHLFWDAGESKWVSEEDFAYDGGSGPVHFWIDTGRPRMTIDGVEGIWVTTTSDGLGFSFGGTTLCASGGCDSYFVAHVLCIACPTAEGVFETPQFSVPPGQTVEEQFQVRGLVVGTPPDWAVFQFTIPNSGDGLEQFQLRVVSPDGTVFQLVTNPTGLDSDNYQVALRLSTVDNYDQFQTANGVSQYTVGPYETDHDNFQTYSGPVNGVWQFVVQNDNPTATMEVEQFQLVWGSPAHNLTLAVVADPTSGESPLAVELDWTIGGTGECFFVEVDWGDGSAKEYFLPEDKPQTHTFSSDGNYEIIVRAWADVGTYVEDSATVAVGAGAVPGYDCDTAGLITTPFSDTINTQSLAYSEQWLYFVVPTPAIYDFIFTGVTGQGLHWYLYSGTSCGSKTEIGEATTNVNVFSFFVSDFVWMRMVNETGGVKAYQFSADVN